MHIGKLLFQQIAKKTINSSKQEKFVHYDDDYR